MSKLVRCIEELLFPLIAATSLLVSLADLFGLFHLIPASSIPLLTLLLVSLVLNSLVVIQRRCAEMLERTHRLLSNIVLEQMAKEVLAQIDPNLLRALKDDYFLDVIEFLQTAIKESKVQVNDIARLRYYYIRTMHCYPKATFLSSNSSAISYLWEDHAIEDATAVFIRNGGKMKRIILVKDNQELASQELQEKVERQRKIGVQIYIVNGNATPADLKKNFLVESKGKIAWEMQVDHGDHVGASTVTTNKRVTSGYCRIFEKLRESETGK